MADVFVVNPIRTAVGKAFRGSLAKMRPDDFGAQTISALLKRCHQLDPNLIEDVVVGCAMPEAEQGMNTARFTLLLAGLPESVPGVTINRFCCSGVQSIAMAADRIKAGEAECIIAGGIESMSLIPMMGHKVVGSRTVNERFPDFYLNMGLTAENVAEEYKVSRTDQDQFALDSHIKAAAAIKNKTFGEEIIPITVTKRMPDKDGAVKVETMSLTNDEGPRSDTTLAALSQLKPAFKQGGTVTAGNSSQMSDGAAMCLVVSEKFLSRHKLQPMARFVGYAVKGVAPRVMGIGPVAAIPKVLDKAGIKLDQVDRIELNEAFAAQAVAVIKTLHIDARKVNPNGGAIALGHPLGATGAKLTATLLHGMKRDRQKYGLVTMCIGTGMGAAALFENVI